MGPKKESKIGLKEYAIENGKKVDLSILKSSIKGSKEYSDGRKVMVRACNDVFIEYEGGILLVERELKDWVLWKSLLIIIIVDKHLFL